MVLSRDIDGLEAALEELHKQVDIRTYKQEVLITFWFAIERQDTVLAQILYRRDPIIENIMMNLRKKGADDLK